MGGGIAGGSKGGHGGVERWGLGRNPRVRKPEQELGQKDGGAVVRREGVRVRQHNTKQLIVATGIFLFSF